MKFLKFDSRAFSNRFARLGLLIACLLSFGLVASRAGADPTRVMSFNIRYGTAKDGENHWDKRQALVVKTIQEFSPDLLGTQEALGFQKRYLEEQLPQYTGMGVGRDDGGQSGEMTAIFFRTDRYEHLDEGHFWLSETPEVAGSKSWDSSLPRICSWVKLRDRLSEGPPILFVNTHFDHRGPEARKQSALLVRKKIEELGKGFACVLTGDFNAAPDSEPHRILFTDSEQSEPDGIKLIDTFAATHPDATGRESSFSGFRPNVTEGSRIDWIAVSEDWQINAATIDRTDYDGRLPSDHYAITATLRIAPSPSNGKR